MVALNKADADTNKVKLLNDLAWSLKASSPSRAMEYALLGNQLAQKLSYDIGLSRSYKCSGVIYLIQGSYSKALSELLKAVSIDERLGDKRSLAASLMNIGTVYKNQQIYNDALEYYQRAIDIMEELNMEASVAAVYNNVGVVYMERSDYDNALVYMNKSLLIKEKFGDRQGMANTYNNLGVIHLNKDDWEEAVEFYFKALKIREELNDKMGLATSYYNIGEVYILQKKYSIGYAYAQKGVEIAKETKNLKGLEEAYKVLASGYSQQGNYQQAYDNLLLFTQTRDSLFAENKSKEMMEMKEKYESEKLRFKLVQSEAQAGAENEKIEAQLKAKNIQRNGLILGFIFLSVFAMLLFKAFRQKQKANEQLESQNNAIREQNIKIETQHDLLSKKNKLITDSIDYAKRIQKSLLPDEQVLRQHFSDSFILLKPKDIVSGDFFWFHKVEDKILFAAVDCTGHGVPGALMSIIGYNLLEQTIVNDKITSPEAVLSHVNKKLKETLSHKGKAEGIRDGMDIARCSLDTTSYELAYAGAKNPLYIVSDNELKTIKADNGSIGGQTIKVFTEHHVQLKQGDVLYVFTDGFADQKGGANRQKFFYAPFKNLIQKVHQLPADKQRVELEKTFNAWRGEEDQIDDVLVAGIRI